MVARHRKRLIKSVLLFTFLLTPLLAIAEPMALKPTPSTEVEILVAPTSPVPLVIERDEVLCNCYLFVKTELPKLPSTKEILSNVATSGVVAVFYYPDIGMYHYAIIRDEMETSFLIEETNYDACERGTRVVPKDDPRLIGFYTP